MYVSCKSLPETTLSSDVPRIEMCECLRRLQAGFALAPHNEAEGRRNALIGLLADVERELLEPVDRLGDFVHADNHAARLDLDPVRVEVVVISKQTRTVCLLDFNDCSTHLINSSSSSSRLG